MPSRRREPRELVWITRPGRTLPTPMTRPRTDRLAAGPIASVDSPSVHRIRPAHQQVAEQLRRLILFGGFAPGERLPVEARLAASFGFSRTTVCDAPWRLARQGLVNTITETGSGTVVVTTGHASVSERLETGMQLLGSNDDISASEFFETRALLEIHAARLAALRRDPQALIRLSAAVEREQSLSLREERFDVGQHFHAVVLAAAGNRLLTVLAAPLLNVVRARCLGETQCQLAWEQIGVDMLKSFGASRRRARPTRRPRCENTWNVCDTRTRAGRGGERPDPARSRTDEQ